ncbi:MAG: P-loop NTPase [Pseudomonadota bacterium]
MSLIDKTAEKLAAQRARRRVLRPSYSDVVMPVPRGEAGEHPAQESFEERTTLADAFEDDARSDDFSINFKRLRRWGFLTPDTRRSRTSEEMRLIKRRLMQRMTLSQAAKDRPEKATTRTRGRGTPHKRGREHVILVTSARPNEGKSFVSTNLALSIVLDEGYNVLLGDADVLRPSLSKILGIGGRPPGLTDLLTTGGPSIPQVMLRESTLPLSFIGAGTAVASATDLFGGMKMSDMISDIADRYDDRIIIFDAPPLLASTEPVALAQHVGQILLVVDAESTPRGAVEAALDLLEPDAQVSLVLNNSTMKYRLEQFGTYYDYYSTPK